MNPSESSTAKVMDRAIDLAIEGKSPYPEQAAFTIEGVEPTNNAAERALRGPVIYRKLSHGTQSKDGERLIERALPASVTCRLQDRSLFAYMRQLLAAHARDDPLPTLT